MSRSKVRNLLLLKQIHSAVAHIKKGKLDKALETLDKAENSARKSKSTNALYYILFTRGSILYTAAKYDDALETYERALGAGGDLGVPGLGGGDDGEPGGGLADRLREGLESLGQGLDRGLGDLSRELERGLGDSLTS